MKGRPIKSLRLLLIIMVTSIGFSFIAAACSKTAPAKDPGTAAVKPAVAKLEGTGKITVYRGKIDNKNITPGTIKGETVYDKNCTDQPNNMMVCDGGIYTKEYGLLNFHYRHNMSEEDCIAPKLVATVIVKENNEAEVQLQEAK